MTKADKILILCIMILSAVLIIPILNGAAGTSAAVVKVQNEEVLRIDLSEDGEYSVDGTLGAVNIEVKDGAVRVTQENSPNHLCSKQGFVSDANVPIVCLPNHTVITIESDEKGSEDVMIQ